MPTGDAASKSHNKAVVSQEWWRTEPNPTTNHVTAKERYQEALDDVRRLDQNRWLGKRAKKRRFEFSAEQKRMLRQWFNALDADGSGKISVEELEDPMLSIGIVSDRNEIKEIVSRLDKDANGLIDFREFVDFLTPHARHSKDVLGKHEQMFMLLTKKMEHQSAGFLEINTQLSMERRRFILDAITHRSAQALMEDIAQLKVPTAAELRGSPKDRQNLRHQRSMARKIKLEALATQHEVEMRFQALQDVLTRNSQLSVSSTSDVQHVK
ncbi:hypothetical protein Poli38472_004582 [Pythium oligandrum]|uniref:EF-hand domain-containing protein n=1 Tax=Pythium oligandrum TaxID=41045 RepID=A0A8K1CBB2_PYTOL|nr:hypothetical protein Poli38472_004582 [Pythium oligandrum]|eukprot:TMW59513.1 hypothetical protein Poli38472_004582 [Pythium oligandrum]